MSNFEPYPDEESEARLHAGIANRIRQSSVVLAGVSVLGATAEVGYRVLERLPNPLESNIEMKTAVAGFAISCAVAATGGAYETIVRHRYGLAPVSLTENSLAILEPTEQ